MDVEQAMEIDLGSAERCDVAEAWALLAAEVQRLREENLEYRRSLWALGGDTLAVLAKLERARQDSNPEASDGQ